MSNKVKPNCYACKFRRNVPGDAHSSCAHPKTSGSNDPFTALVQIAAGIAPPGMKELDIKANRHGFMSGWFLWPSNFDPVWLENCNGFEEKSKDE
jgi:hypothetical protein